MRRVNGVSLQYTCTHCKDSTVARPSELYDLPAAADEATVQVFHFSYMPFHKNDEQSNVIEHVTEVLSSDIKGLSLYCCLCCQQGKGPV